jgi:MFS transporter, DHA2 family, glioxin efflux transporter
MFIAGGWGSAVSDTILNNLLLRRLPYYIPNIDPHAVLAIGAAGIKDVYEGEVLRGVRQAYLDGLHGSLALAIAAFGVAFLWGLGPEWPGRLSTMTKELPDDHQDVGVELKSDC